MDTYKEQLNYLVSLVESDKNIDWEEVCKKLNLNINKDSLRKAFNTTKFSGYNVYKYFQNLQEQHRYSEQGMKRIFHCIYQNQKSVHFQN